MRLASLLTLLCLALADNASAGSTAPVQQLVEALAFPAQTEVRFEQRQLNPLFKRVSSQRGVMLKAKDGRLIMRVIDPRPEVRTIHDGTVSLTRKVANRQGAGMKMETQRTQLDTSRPSHLVLHALEALLNGDTAGLEAHFDLELTNQGEPWRIRLQPKDPKVRNQISRLWISGTGDTLRSFRSERDNDQGGFTHFLEVEIYPAEAP